MWCFGFLYPPVNWHSYGKWPLQQGKSSTSATHSIATSLLKGIYHIKQSPSTVTSWCFFINTLNRNTGLFFCLWKAYPHKKQDKKNTKAKKETLKKKTYSNQNQPSYVYMYILHVYIYDNICICIIYIYICIHTYIIYICRW